MHTGESAYIREVSEVAELDEVIVSEDRGVVIDF